MGYGSQTVIPCDKGPATVCNTIYCYHGDCRQEGFLPSCDCHVGWTGLECGVCCDLKCENGGTCEENFGTEFIYCNCPDNFTGLLCQDKVNATQLTEIVSTTGTSDRPPIYANAIAVTAVVCLVLLALSAICVIIAYKQRHVYLLKVINKLRWRFEKNADFDVYMAYPERDRSVASFVEGTLRVKLMEWGFNLCLPYIHFDVPGCKFENIIDKIQRSRRTMLIICRPFVQEEWTEFETQRALIETLKKSNGIIPVIYDPVDEYKRDMSPTLKHIIDSIYCMEWPRDGDQKKVEAFWTRLRNSLPKCPIKIRAEIIHV